MANSYTSDVEEYQQIVGVDALEEVYARLQATEGAVAGDADDNEARDAAGEDGEDDTANYIRVVDAFAMPWITYDGEKKAFALRGQTTSSTKQGAASSGKDARKKPSLAGAADSKAQYLRDRYNILKQVILRNEHFSPPALPGHDRENYMKVRQTLCSSNPLFVEM
jgi:DNA polymerase epsilon subunit 2